MSARGRAALRRWAVARVAMAACASLTAYAPACLAQLPTAPAVVQQPRSFGYVLGDVLPQRISLDDASGRAAVPVVPPAARVNAYLDRLPSRVETDREGRHWLVLQYQVINAPRDLSLSSLPALTVELKSGTGLKVPEWPVSIAPLTPDAVFEQGDLQAMRPDHPAEPHATERVVRRLRLWVALLGVVLLAWLGALLWRNARDATRMPFARAARAVRRAPESADGWVALHRAFNDTAGRVVQRESLPALFDRAPFLNALRPDIERFFAASSERFFARAGSAPVLPLEDFSRRLRQAEKQGGSPRGA